MIFTPEGFTDNLPMSPDPYMTVIKTSARKPPRQFFKYWMSNKILLYDLFQATLYTSVTVVNKREHKSSGAVSGIYVPGLHSRLQQ